MVFPGHTSSERSWLWIFDPLNESIRSVCEYTILKLKVYDHWLCLHDHQTERSFSFQDFSIIFLKILKVKLNGHIFFTKIGTNSKKTHEDRSFYAQIIVYLSFLNEKLKYPRIIYIQIKDRIFLVKIVYFQSGSSIFSHFRSKIVYFPSMIDNLQSGP